MQGITITLDELLALRYSAQQLYLSQKNRSHHAQQGEYQSPFRGPGMDFVETRIYLPGDDIRNINWSVTARTGKPHTKIYQQEREQPIYLIIDFNSTMFFGTRNAFKSVIAAQAAAIIAWAALKNGDKIGSLLLKEGYKIIRPCHQKQNLLEFFKHLVTYVLPTKNVSIDYISAFKQLNKTLKTGSTIYFLSDFYSLNEQVERELVALSKRHELTNIFIYDALEKDPPKKGYYLFHDQVASGSLRANMDNAAFRKQYKAIFDNRLRRLQKLCFAKGMHLLELSTDDDLITALRHILRAKK